MRYSELVQRKLRAALLGVGCLAVLSSCMAGAADTSADRAKLEEVESHYFDLYNHSDAAGVAALYAADAVVMPSGAPVVRGRAAIQAFMTKGIGEMKQRGLTLKLGAIDGVGVSGDLGWISGIWSAVNGAGAVVDGGAFIDVHQRGSGDWLIVRDIWNSDRALPAPPAAAVPPGEPPAAPASG